MQCSRALCTVYQRRWSDRLKRTGGLRDVGDGWVMGQIEGRSLSHNPFYSRSSYQRCRENAASEQAWKVNSGAGKQTEIFNRLVFKDLCLNISKRQTAVCCFNQTASFFYAIQQMFTFLFLICNTLYIMAHGSFAIPYNASHCGAGF